MVMIFLTIINNSNNNNSNNNNNKTLSLSHRVCEEVTNWIREKELIASNELLGKDLEHVEILQKKFAGFVLDVMASEDRILEVNRMADSLIETNHTGKINY